jgi:hypothetical protein
VKLLIDECLHTSLVEPANAAGHVADHVNYLGLGCSKDRQLMATIRAQDYTFVRGRCETVSVGTGRNQAIFNMRGRSYAG